MRFDIRYTAEYRYPEPVTDSLNTLRVQPAVTPYQSVESFDFEVDPDARVQKRRDYFGTDVIEFEIADRPASSFSRIPTRSRPRTRSRSCSRRWQPGRRSRPRSSSAR